MVKPKRRKRQHHPARHDDRDVDPGEQSIQWLQPQRRRHPVFLGFVIGLFGVWLAFLAYIAVSR